MPRTERVRTPQPRAGSGGEPGERGALPPVRAPHCPRPRAGAWRVGGGHGGARRLLAAGSVEGTECEATRGQTAVPVSTRRPVCRALRSVLAAPLPAAWPWHPSEGPGTQRAGRCRSGFRSALVT